MAEQTETSTVDTVEEENIAISDTMEEELSAMGKGDEEAEA